MVHLRRLRRREPSPFLSQLLFLNGFLLLPLVFVHQPVSPAHHVIHRVIHLRIIHRHSSGDVHLLPKRFFLFPPFLTSLIEQVDQFLSVLIIKIPQNDSELIPADTEHGTVIENIAYQRTG